MSNPQPTRGNREAGGDSAAALAQYNETVVLAQLLQSPPLDDAVRWLDCRTLSWTIRRRQLSSAPGGKRPA